MTDLKFNYDIKDIGLRKLIHWMDATEIPFDLGLDFNFNKDYKLRACVIDDFAYVKLSKCNGYGNFERLTEEKVPIAKWIEIESLDAIKKCAWIKEVVERLVEKANMLEALE